MCRVTRHPDAGACNPLIEFDFSLVDSYLAFSRELREAMREMAVATLMYLKCAHPDCSADFDYGQGRLFRFQHNPSPGPQTAHWHAVKHFWLCSRCCESYNIEYHKGTGVLLLVRLEKLAREQPGYFVLQPETSAQPGLPRRVARSGARAKKHRVVESSPIGVMEVLETRNLL